MVYVNAGGDTIIALNEDLDELWRFVLNSGWFVNGIYARTSIQVLQDGSVLTYDYDGADNVMIRINPDGTQSGAAWVVADEIRWHDARTSFFGGELNTPTTGKDRVRRWTPTGGIEWTWNQGIESPDLTDNAETEGIFLVREGPGANAGSVYISLKDGDDSDKMKLVPFGLADGAQGPIFLDSTSADPFHIARDRTYDTHPVSSMFQIFVLQYQNAFDTRIWKYDLNENLLTETTFHQFSANAEISVVDEVGNLYIASRPDGSSPNAVAGLSGVLNTNWTTTLQNDETIRAMDYYDGFIYVGQDSGWVEKIRASDGVTVAIRDVGGGNDMWGLMATRGTTDQLPGYDQTVAVGGPLALTHTGFAPVVDIGAAQVVAPPAAAFTHTGFAPTITGADTAVQPPANALNHAGLAPTVDDGTGAGETVSPPTKALNHAGQAPEIGVEPDDLANLVNWFKSDTGTWQNTAGTTAASSDTDPVRRWDDQGSAGENVTQDNSTSPSGTSNTGNPQLQTGELNGYPAIDFGSTELLWNSSYSLDNTEAATILIVGKRNTSGNQGVAQFQNGASAGAAFGVTSEFAIRVNSGSRVFVSNPMSSVSYDYFVIQRTASDAVENVTVRHNGSSASQTSATTENLTNPTTAELVLGQTAQNTPDNGDVSLVEVAVYDRKLSATEVDQLETYVRDRYSL